MNLAKDISVKLEKNKETKINNDIKSIGQRREPGKETNKENSKEMSKELGRFFIENNHDFLEYEEESFNPWDPIEIPSFNYFSDQKIAIHKVYTKNTMKLYSKFYLTFNLLPEFIYQRSNQVLILLRSEDFTFYNKSFELNKQKYRNLFPNLTIYFKIYSDVLGILVFNLFSHIRSDCLNDLYFEDVKLKKEMGICLELDDEKVPQALGKSGKYIHFLNDFFKHVHFKNKELEEKYVNKKIYIRNYVDYFL